MARPGGPTRRLAGLAARALLFVVYFLRGPIEALLSDAQWGCDRALEFAHLACANTTGSRTTIT
jgi:hypothetical protein